ncbi:MAG TPA: DUF1569 domain-containing protein [Terracidiphilus sp.]|jgi:hypothetical protein
MKSLSDRNCLEELISRVTRVRPDTPRRWGKMTSAQMICHLNDSFLGIIGEKPMEIPRGFTLWPVMKYIALYAPMEWPKGVSTRPEFDQHAGAGTPPAHFKTDVRSLLDTMIRFARRPRDFQFRPHPMFKEMSEAQWMRWGYLHVDHHLRQFGQ